MSRVSVVGSQRVMNDVVESVHDLNLLHITDYDDSWEGFNPGDPMENADDAAENLVTVRSLMSILNVEEAVVGRTRVIDLDAIDKELEEVREQVNELDDRRSDLESDLNSIEERIDAVEPFVRLGIDLDLLSGYDNISVAVGEGDAEAIREALSNDDDVSAFQVFAEEGSVAVFAYPAELPLQEALVGGEFTSFEIPEDAEGSPEEYVAELHSRKEQLESRLNSVENELEDIRQDVAEFLLAAEERLTIEVQKQEAPLSFATTDNAFVAEGWIPTERVTEFKEAIHDAVGSLAEVEELERADYDEHGHAHAHESGEDADKEVTADGGTDQPMSGGNPPVVQDNPGPVKPFEALVEVVNRPNYHELDPTVILFLTFPAFFGFMIGDLGYGLLYMGIGYALFTRFESDIIRSLGGVALWAGGFTALFGILYGEIFGLETVAKTLWGGHPPLRKGLRPANADWLLLWLVISLLAGITHLSIGWILDFYENLKHGFGEAMLESGSWLMMMFGLWAWIFSGASGKAPDLLVGSESVFNGNPLSLGFAGLPEPFGLVGLAVFAVGLLMLIYGEPIEAVEFLNVLVNVLSYTRMAAVLLAKAGMAFVVNLLFFGAYVEDGEFHFMINEGPEYVMEHAPEAEIMFSGLAHGGIAALFGGIIILVVGHLLVLILGITSAGLQAVRLEYVEFFGKFYEGGGKPYRPFGQERQYTDKDHRRT